MCGIAGIKFGLDNKDIAINRMLDSMRLRGPDNRGDYYEEDIALGHCRLKVIDLSPQGDQPMSNENKDIWVVHNGEIYNFKELRQLLEELGHRFKSQTDTEVVLHSYEEWGRDCVKKFRGMFAFAIWDRNNRELFLARDRLGIKPLYYYYKNGVFIFASQVKAILETGWVSKKLSCSGLLTYLDSGGLREPWTIVEDVYSLAPASYMIINDDGFRIARYWDLFETNAENSSYQGKDIVERINILLKESIQLHLVSDVPLGIFLSGGVDSSSLLSLAVKKIPKIRCISLVYRNKGLSEDRFIQLVAAKYRIDHREVLLEADYFLKNLSAAILAMDEPTFNGINTYFISKVAKESGLTVVLSGLGGDEVFCGYQNFRRIQKLNNLSRLIARFPASMRRALSRIFIETVPVNQRDKIAEFIKDAPSSEQIYFWMRRLFLDKQKIKLFKNSTLLEKTTMSERIHHDLINQISYLELNNYMRDILLRDTDFMSMAHSLEVRVPYLDHKLVEFMFSIPGRFKVEGPLNKPLLINSLDDTLPEDIIKRKKRGFVLPFDFWLRNDLKAEVEDTLRAKNHILNELLDEKEILCLWKGYLKGRISWQCPWAIYVLKKWVEYTWNN